jgi:diguanylate cyclase (GGDEF)-like protein/PAS domain S-box-containing protein
MVSLLLLSLVVSLYTYSVYQARLEDTFSREIDRYRLGSQVIKDHLLDIVKDIQILAYSQALITYLNHGSVQSLDALNREHHNFSRYKRVHDQIRFLDPTGEEISRVNFDDGIPYIVMKNELQNKRDRYYFTDTFRLDRDQIFISPMDLNIEKGQIEDPLKPIIRVGTPVYDDNGKKRGILLINYLASNLISKLREQLSDSTGDSFLLNNQGYWLMAPDSADAWGFMFNNGRNLSKRYPEVWQHMKTGDSGQRLTQNGLFTWNTVYPLAQNNSSDTAKISQQAEYFWKVGTHIRADIISDISSEFINRAFYLILMLSPAFIVTSFLITRFRFNAKRSLHDLKNNVELQKAITTDIAEGLMVLDLQGKVISINPEAEKLLGIVEKDMINKDALGLLHKTATNENIEDLKIMAVTKSRQPIRVEEDIFNHSNGNPLNVSYKASPLFKDDRVHGVIVAFEDISERKQLKEKLTYMALYDELTGLYNRRQIENLLKTTFLQTQRYLNLLCIALIDIDHFKQINDEHGHLCGDEVLRKIGTLIMESTRAADTAGRYGGEEFLIILHATSLEGAHQWAEQIRKKVSSHPSYLNNENVSLDLSISIGLAAYNIKTKNYEGLIHEADMALYQAKSEGRNRVCGYTPDKT